MTSLIRQPSTCNMSSGLRAGVMAIALLIAGCASPSLKTVKLVRIERTSGIEPLKWKVLPELERKDPQLRVTMDTGDSVRELARRYELHVSVDAFFCGDRDHRLVAYPAVFDQDGNISDSPVRARDPNDTQVWIYLAASSSGHQGGQYSAGKNVSYDLTSIEQNVCVELRGGSMSLRRLKAPVVSIPAEQVRHAAQSGPEVK